MVAPTFEILYHNDLTAPLGKITHLGITHNGTGTERGVLRVFGSYALAYFLEGTGEYRDANGVHHKLVAGDLVLITPELPHRYTTRPGQYWSECYVIFDGPVFDLCLQQGVLNPSRPILHREPVEHWRERLTSLVTSPHSTALSEKSREVNRLVALLTELYAEQPSASADQEIPEWLSRAKERFGQNVETELTPQAVAQSLGVPYETFRKGFKKYVGVAPSLYRTQKRVEVACRLLQLTTMTQQRIAEHLGFLDAYHFSKRFKQLMGMSPRQYRRMSYGKTHPEK